MTGESKKAVQGHRRQAGSQPVHYQSRDRRHRTRGTTGQGRNRPYAAQERLCTDHLTTRIRLMTRTSFC
ncbi:hypothetical protein SAM23877_5881 [Streptomyces ambofaciens ATCC 23877]|uniref:Uncharacterized protein n=1 Tax=Streptomyces ambofaciens (strain ATCC 23877 / 3486 / DSM 40053 / JCM 4204 / NBRC 12836 / NRRL B-2516) TaxID=278992 RepID=A0A0K2B197_STRA7|nr:hypothetical protein SAM23877_5881 [Streptomyces ambofaciens ATCC 23877]